MRIAFISSRDKLSGKITRFFTGSYCYHVGFTDGIYFWDMHLLARRRYWWGLYPTQSFRLVDTPVEVSAECLDDFMTRSNDVYSITDYLLFALRPIYHLFGKSTRNRDGMICSELVADVLIDNGWEVKFDEVPSPADLERLLVNGVYSTS